MARVFGALARGLTGYRSGKNQREQIDADRDMKERDLQRRAFEFAVQQRAQEQWRQDQQDRWNDDRAVRDRTATEERERKNLLEHTNAIEQGWENAEDPTSAMTSAMSVLQGGTGAATQGFDPKAVERAGRQTRGVAPFAGKAGDITYGSPTRVGAVQRGQLGGKQMVFDPQKKANAVTEKAWQAELAKIADDQRTAAQREHDLRLAASLRPAPASSRPRPMTGNAITKINREMLTSESAIRQVEDAIAATKGVKDFAGPVDNMTRKLRNGMLQGVMSPQPERDNAAGVYASVVTPIITGEFGAALTKLERDYISPHVPALAEAREEQIPQILERIKRALEQAREEQLYALEASDFDTAPLQRARIPQRPDRGNATAPNQTGKPKPGVGAKAQTGGETDEQRVRRLLGLK